MPRKNSTDDKSRPVEQIHVKLAKPSPSIHPESNEPSEVASRRQRQKTTIESFPLQLAWLERASLILFTRSKANIKSRLRALGDGSQVVEFTRMELQHLFDMGGKATTFASPHDKKRLEAIRGQIADLLGVERPTTGLTTAKSTDVIYQIKITLRNIKPPIWRRIQIPDCTLADLHEYLQAAFGWGNYHLHEFEIDREHFGPFDPDAWRCAAEVLDEAMFTLGKLLKHSGRKPRWLYTYDFGDGWKHEILIEGSQLADPAAKYPRCVKGSRACPPEDCGGPWGYEDYIDAIADPTHDRHGEMLEWRGPYDPEAFDAEQATIAMSRVRPTTK